VASPQEHLATSRRILETYLPWEAERARHAELTDANGILAGSFAPTIRKPVLRLPSGKVVFGLGDAVAVNDPITGQGSNNATKACRVYLDAILAHGEQPFTEAWMQQTFERFWSYAQYVVEWTNTLLTPPPPHILKLLGAAGQCPALARAIANGFDNPPDFFPWWTDAQACDRFIDSQLAAAAAAT
jgi:flavin-dependent dehydrogenase